MKGHIFICVHCKRPATDEDIEFNLAGPPGKKKEAITVWCPSCKVHSHYLKKK